MDCGACSGDLTKEVLVMSLHLVMSREGHFKEVFHIFGHLKKLHNLEMVFDPSIPKVNLDFLPKEDWGYLIYSTPGKELKEGLPPNMPKPLREDFVLQVYVDVDHTGGSLTQQSRSSFIMFLNNAPSIGAVGSKRAAQRQHMDQS